ncbi:Dual specificity mitogen-activated protein kinase kinase 7 [Didymosphaeria variabile]|uniref:Dual specificity mitogen-activated protein kinase kinase 7 n=1 Tax=Didymosphaeria variabile TaxID=1932322 RepID=A0A9W8XH01_9PLEO|nr:Dual specificity mitogen-activated protein kinase kinase 7 [Didymosphaeria variabile]KAJ4350486.1 Dual specificity mitogen-activated protein kinase kinase 7 [Didymosphaeria variabile]
MPPSYPPMPSAYAVKVPYEKTAHRVLAEEGRILSYLSRFPAAERYLVPYYGQDTRTDALIMGYMPSTLDSLIATDLNTRDETDRAAMLADIFPHIATNLLDGLAWLQDKSCIHGDIKPSNILLAVNPSTHTPHAVFADFSAAILPSLPVDGSKKTNKPMGGATWDFMAPDQLTSTSTPSFEADVWALAMSILILVTGASPYERVAPNAILKREILKQGAPLDYVSAGENGVRSVLRLGALSRGLGFNFKKWVGKVLVRDERQRLGMNEWRDELADVLM